MITETKLPDGTKIQVLNLEKISLKGLEARDATEIQKLVSAAKFSGLFYLDFHGSETGNLLLEEIGEVYCTCEKYFDQPFESKFKDVRTDQEVSQDKGYKFCATDETFEMSYDELVKGDLYLPLVLQPSKYTMKFFSEICHNATLTMLQVLNANITTKSFQECHARSKSSDSGLKLVYEPCIQKKSKVIENKHKDGGTLTILFYDEWGLHAQLPDGDWAFAAPVPGCALVNVADALEKASEGKLRSPVHRVTQPVDGFVKRYFLSYFLRPGSS
ncbi:hypothetical protein TWF694_011115 [Orbilia ellipsospora]|uniref:Fe2OG dioxygenase domain-containing protein n=1 Tax=Orbilia ellipsospora TaxID=2528407 RepID=A0AAV9X9E8_9PEZI